MVQHFPLARGHKSQFFTLISKTAIINPAHSYGQLTGILLVLHIVTTLLSFLLAFYMLSIDIEDTLKKKGCSIEVGGKTIMFIDRPPPTHFN